jgi:hypothetical protein
MGWSFFRRKKPPEPGHNPKDPDLVKELKERAVELYNDRVQQFNKIFAGLIIVSLFIFFIILVPFVLSAVEAKTHEAEMKRLQENMSAIDGKLELYKSLAGTLDSHVNQILQDPERLAGDSQADVLIVEPQPRQISNEFQFCKAKNLTGDELKGCIASMFALNVNRDYNQTYGKVLDLIKETGSLRGMDPVAVAFNTSLIPHEQVQRDRVLELLVGLDYTNIKRGLQELNATYFKVLQDYPNFWNDENTRERVRQALKSQAYRFLSENPVVRDAAFSDPRFWNLTRFEEYRNLSDQHNKAEGKFNTTQARLDTIKERLLGFESPFGTFPLGFGDTIIAFPFGIAVGFLVCTLIIAEEIRLRRVIDFYYDATYKTPANGTERRITTIWPVWGVKNHHRLVSAIHIALLALPLFLFGYSAVLIVLSIDALKQALDVIELPSLPLRDSLILLYVLGAALSISGIFIIIRTVREKESKEKRRSWLKMKHQR